MQIHQLKRKTPSKKAKYIGRGGKRGTTSGKGTKGQKARAGHKIRPEFRDILKKLPKLRGYKFPTVTEKALPINLNMIEKVFVDGGEITPAILIERGLAKTRGGKTPRIKILGTGNLSRKISISGCDVSASAKEKIEKVGGEVKE